MSARTSQDVEQYLYREQPSEHMSHEVWSDRTQDASNINCKNLVAVFHVSALSQTLAVRIICFPVSSASKYVGRFVMSKQRPVNISSVQITGWFIPLIRLIPFTTNVITHLRSVGWTTNQYICETARCAGMPRFVKNCIFCHRNLVPKATWKRRSSPRFSIDKAYHLSMDWFKGTFAEKKHDISWISWEENYGKFKGLLFP